MPTLSRAESEAPRRMTAKRKAGRPRIHVPPELIQYLREKGLSFRNISMLTGFGYGSVRRAWHNRPGKEKPKGPRES